jgi:hypothetical protein
MLGHEETITGAKELSMHAEGARYSGAVMF